jgi:hypothetical protein
VAIDPLFPTYDVSNFIVAFTNCMGVANQHRLDPMARNLCEVAIVEAGGMEMGDVAVAALVGADI